MRALSVRQASRCETAKTKTCTCRCGGLRHGAMRNLIEEGRPKEPEQEFFETLPADDPHHIPDAAQKKRRAQVRRAIAKMRAYGQGLLFPGRD